MALPIYKKILIKSSTSRQIHSQLDQIDFGENPFIFHFPNSINNQLACIEHIEDYLAEHEINTFSYPIFVVTEVDIEDYTGSLRIIKESKEAPKFYRHKSKQLSVKENQKLDVIKLKQQRLNGLRPNEFMPILKEYGTSAKVISDLSKEHQFLSDVLRKIEGDRNA